MDFFEYASLVDGIAEASNMQNPLWLSMLVGGLCFAIVYVFQAVGLYVIAGRAGYGKRWMAFVPFFNTYYIGVCAQKNKFLGIKTENLALGAAILEFVLFIGYVIYYIALAYVTPYLDYVPNDVQYLNQIITIQVAQLPANFASLHPELAWAGWCYNYLATYILRWVDLVFLFASVIILNCFFQTYSARHYFIFTIACILLPIQGILIFIVRNNKGMNYAEYTRKLQEQMYRQYRNQQDYYQNPYQNNYNNYNNYNNPYNQNPYQNNPNPNGNQNSSADPFSEYGSKPKDDKDPFDEFKN